MAQLRRDYERFQEQNAEILAIAPDTLNNARDYFQKHDIPFPCLADDAHSVYDQYDVQSKWSSLGQRPGLFLIDREGIVRYAYLGTQQWEIPDNATVLRQLARIQDRR